MGCCDMSRSSQDGHGLVHVQGIERDGRDYVECRAGRRDADRPVHHLPPYTRADHVPRTAVQALGRRRDRDHGQGDVEVKPEPWRVARSLVHRRVFQPRNRRRTLSVFTVVIIIIIMLTFIMRLYILLQNKNIGAVQKYK